MSDERGTTVGFGAALAEQLRWFWQRLWTWIVICAVLIAGGALWAISSLDPAEGVFAYIMHGTAFAQILVLIAISWAMSAWRDDPPRDRQYFWLHPVQRDLHTVARTLAGFVWLMLVVSIVVLTVFLASRGVVPPEMQAGSARLWLFTFGAVALAYVAASIPSVLSDRPVVWILFVIAVVIILSAIADMRQITWLQEMLSALVGGRRSFGTGLGAAGSEAIRLVTENLTPGRDMQPPFAQRSADDLPGTALAIWLPVTLLAYLGAVRLSRPR